jgi:hypothetical protein
LTPYFRLKNSVKQGCPISALVCAFSWTLKWSNKKKW